MFDIEYIGKDNQGIDIAKVSVQLAKQYVEMSYQFDNVYKNETFLLLRDNRKELTKKQDRICRFCGNRIPNVKFNKEAHFIPQYFGNKHFLSDFECDTCNHIFSVYENDFANFLGLKRSFAPKTGKKGIPTYKTPDQKFVIRADENDGIRFETELDDIGYFIQDRTKKEINIKHIKYPYVPINVFKCLLKVAVSLIDKEELSKYNETIEFLMNDSLKEPKSPLIAIHQFFIPGPPVKTPLLFLYRKRESVSNHLIPERTMIITFHNYTYQLFIPFDKTENKLNDTKGKIKAFIMPPLVSQNWIDKYGNPVSSLKNLRDIKTVKSDEEKIKFKYE